MDSGSGIEWRTMAPYSPYSAMTLLRPQHFSLFLHLARRFWNHTWAKTNLSISYLWEKDQERKREEKNKVILPVSCPLVALFSWPAFLLHKHLDSALHGRLSPAPQADARWKLSWKSKRNAWLKQWITRSLQNKHFMGHFISLHTCAYASSSFESSLSFFHHCDPRKDNHHL